MLNDEICRLREKLNDSILNQNDYKITYQISVELDELIAQYYSTQVKVVTKCEQGKETKKIIKQTTTNKKRLKQEAVMK